MVVGNVESRACFLAAGRTDDGGHLSVGHQQTVVQAFLAFLTVLFLDFLCLAGSHVCAHRILGGPDVVETESAQGPRG